MLGILAYPTTLRHLEYGGFDLALGLKEVFGWNTYAKRRIKLGF